MFYTKPAKNGIGIELWATKDDMERLYDVIGRFWEPDDTPTLEHADHRNFIISILSYEIRKSFQGGRLRQADRSNDLVYYGVRISWVQILFALAALRFNTRLKAMTKLEASIFLQLEYWIEHAMEAFDPVGAADLQPFFADGIHSGNQYLFQFMRGIDVEFMALGGGKKAFRQLPRLLKQAIYGTNEYNAFLARLAAHAKRLNCEISSIEFKDDHIDYEKLGLY